MSCRRVVPPFSRTDTEVTVGHFTRAALANNSYDAAVIQPTGVLALLDNEKSDEPTLNTSAIETG
ncbi:TPA: hypothetical protein DDX46_02045 [Candidatus Saccharibacteria bacterium]|nr:MAG: hypothetical protein UW38_C0001G0227 [Candidatus Saccharibacteria bacterium GW2011_GWC2_44_17]MBH1956221.1 hypothetical protein [Candidatus Saccharibacteria bacterium]MBH1972609.1 hypothetical protein [Candidatus Saccharibacteria bacterium]MBH1990811.1 hypothetical protein [Candidatus Saccharibacteria bacterium]HBH77508.1 hypothetical protein [Candidatus Saccharibacteria bacterium]